MVFGALINVCNLEFYVERRILLIIGSQLQAFLLYIYDYDDHDSNFFYIWKGPKGPYSVANLKILECNVKFFLVTDAAPPHLVEILSEDSLKLFKKETEQKFRFYGLPSYPTSDGLGF